MAGVNQNDKSDIGLYTETAKSNYAYQSSRALQGLRTATVDILAGGVGANSSHGIADAIPGASTMSKGAVGGTKLSRFAKLAQFAGKAHSMVTQGSCLLAWAMGGYHMGTGINHIKHENTNRGKKKIVGGTAHVDTAGGLAVASTSSGTVVGLPVAGVALAVTGVSQTGKYGYRYSHEMSHSAKWVGGKVTDGAGYVGKGIVSGAKAGANRVWGKTESLKNIAGNFLRQLADPGNFGSLNL